jgi:hypothetical protein
MICLFAGGWFNLATPITKRDPGPAIFPKPLPFKTIPFKYDKKDYPSFTLPPRKCLAAKF